MIKESDVTIIIPHLTSSESSAPALKISLTSLQKTTDSQILIVANGPWREQEFPPDMWIGKQGQCRAVNAAVATVDTPWVLVTNDDMVYPTAWFERLTARVTDDVACVSPQLVEPKEGAPTFLQLAAGGAGGDFDMEKFQKFASSHEGRGLRTGFNLPYLIRKELFDMIGGYDINYDPWGSNGDSDLQYKILLAGAQPYQNTDCVVYHFSQTSGTFHPDNRAWWEKNWHYFISKWGFERASSPEIWQSARNLLDDHMAELKYQPDWAGKWWGKRS